MLDGQLVGVLHFVESVTQLPSGQATVPETGGVLGSAGQEPMVAAQEESRQRTGVAAGQMKERGQRSGVATHREPTLGRGQE